VNGLPCTGKENLEILTTRGSLEIDHSTMMCGFKKLTEAFEAQLRFVKALERASLQDGLEAGSVSRTAT
jgi:hypothetical protein